MELTIKQKKICNFLLIAVLLFYTLSMATKLAYSATLVNVCDEFAVSKADASVGLSFYYVVYATVQIFLAPIAKKINLKLYLLVTTLLSVASFSILSFANNITTFNIVLLINGLFQAGIYMSCFYFLGKYLPKVMNGKISVVVSTGFPIGTALAYGSAALFTALGNWRLSFIFLAVLFLVSLILLLIAIRQAEVNIGDIKEKVVIENNKTSKVKDKKVVLLFIYIALVEVFVSSSYYLLNNWLPSLLYDIYAIPKTYSLLITIIMPIFLTVGPFLVVFLGNQSKNYYIPYGIISLISAIFPIVLIFFYDANVVVAVLCSLLFLLIPKGVSATIASFVPLQYNDKLNSGTSSCMVNVAASYCAALMPYLSGKMLDVQNGWEITYILTACLAIMAFVSFIPLMILKKEGKI